MISYAGISVYSDGMQFGMTVYVGILFFLAFRNFHSFWIFLSNTRGCRMTSCMPSGRRR